MESRTGRKRGQAMATRWRRRRMCILLADRPAPAAIREISALGAFLETNERPEIGARVELRHPDAGVIEGEVRMQARDGIGIVFRFDARSVAFALAAIGADMTHPR